MAAQAILTQDLANPLRYRSVNEGVDQVLLSQVEGTQAARSLWADATATSANLATGANVAAIQLGSAASTVTIPGNLTVQGTTTTISTTNLVVSDALIYANDGGADPSFAGIAWDQGAALDVICVYNPTNNRIELGRFDTAGGTSVPAGALATLEDLRISDLSLAGTNVLADASLTVSAGGAGALTLNTPGGSVLNLAVGGTNRWQVTSGGNLTTVSGGLTIGSSSGGRPQSVFVDNLVQLGDGGGSLATIRGAASTLPGSGSALAILGSDGTGGTGAPGAAVSIAGGSGDAGAGGTGGALNLSGGAGTAAAAAGGAVAITGGTSTVFAGGAVTISGGSSLSATGTSGGVTISTPTVAGAGIAGNVALSAGTATGGTNGEITFASNGSAAFPYNSPTNQTPSSGASIIEAINLALAGGGVTDWAGALAGGASSGANSPIIQTGQIIRGEDIAGSSPLTMRAGNSSGTTGGAASLTGGTALTTFAGGAATLTGGEAFGSGAGGAAGITGGQSSTGFGGAVNVIGGTSLGGASGGNVLVQGGFASTATGGSVNIRGGNSSGASTGGGVGFKGGTGGTTGTGGVISFVGGDGGTTSGAGGTVQMIGGSGTLGAGGAVQILGGNGTGGNNVGGTLFMSAGNSVGTGAGGASTLEGGDGGATGAGGSLTLRGGAGGSTSGAGGDVLISGGTVTSGNAGRVVFTSGGTTYGLTASGGAGPALVTTAQTVIEAINEVANASPTITLTNASGGAITQGQVVYLTTTADEVDLADATANNAASFPIAVVSDASIADTSSGQFANASAGPVTLRLVTGLGAITSGTQVYLSTTAGSCTTVAPSTTGNVVEPIGTIKDPLSYDGGADLLVEVILRPGNRSLA